MAIQSLELEKLNNEIIYFDNAATSFPKPKDVIEAEVAALRFCSANPGRSGHFLSVKAGEIVFEARYNLASYFGVSNPMAVVFDLNATAALNLAIKGFAYMHKGIHVITSSMEHNSTIRPLVELVKEGVVSLNIAKGNEDGILSVEELDRLKKPHTKLLVLNHASNVTGATQPLREICKWCRENNIISVIDVSQSAGFENINMRDLGIDIVCFTGHKGFYGPMGIGGMLLNDGFDYGNIKSLKQGGTGSFSEKLTHPEILPDIFESGTLPVPAIAGLNAGVKFVKNNQKVIKSKKEKLEKYFLENIAIFENVELYVGNTVNGLVSFRIKGISVSKITDILSCNGIMSRQGLHCAPLAHRRLGTFPEGLVRFSFGFMNEFWQIDKALEVLKKDIIG